MPQVRYQLSDRNLKNIAECVQLPYSTRRLAQKVLDERATAMIRKHNIERTGK